MLQWLQIPEVLKQEAQDISCAVQSIVEEEDIQNEEELKEIVSKVNAVSVFGKVSPEEMKEEQQKDPILGLVYKYVTAGEKPITSAITKMKSKAVRKYLLQFKWLTLKKGVLHRLYINNNVEYHQLILPIKYQAQVLKLLHDGQGHQGLERTLALGQERFYWNTMFQDVSNYVKTCPHCQTVKGDYTDLKTKLGSKIANNPMDLLCIDFTKVDPSKSSKENILVLTDAFTKFSQVFVTPNQKALPWQKYWWTSGFMYMASPHKYIVTKAGPLITKLCNICMLCMVLSNPPPHHTTHLAVLNAKGLTI